MMKGHWKPLFKCGGWCLFWFKKHLFGPTELGIMVSEYSVVGKTLLGRMLREKITGLIYTEIKKGGMAAFEK